MRLNLICMVAAILMIIAILTLMEPIETSEQILIGALVVAFLISFINIIRKPKRKKRSRSRSRHRSSSSYHLQKQQAN